MNSAAVHKLAAALTPAASKKFQRAFADTRAGRLGKYLHADREKFVYAYMDVGFGWDAVAALAETHSAFPALDDDVDILWKAYLYCTGDCDDANIADALAFKLDVMTHARETLEALLLAQDATHASVAKDLGLRPAVVKAYEKLFFNVLDRKQDHLYLTQIVYPNGRLEEMYGDYIKTAPFGQILKRAGVNHGAWDVLFLAGVVNGVSPENSKQLLGKLEHYLLLNGLIMARNGWVNAQSHNMGVAHARAVLTTSKVGGQDTGSGSPFTTTTLGEVFAGEVVRVQTERARAALLRQAETATPRPIEAQLIS